MFTHYNQDPLYEISKAVLTEASSNPSADLIKGMGGKASAEYVAQNVDGKR